MTNLEALIGEVEPYTASQYTTNKKLQDASLEPGGTYSAANKQTIAKCAVSILVAMLPLASDRTGKSSQTYSREGLEDRIKDLCNENGLPLPDCLSVPYVEICPSII